MDGGTDQGSDAGLSAYEEAARNRKSAARRHDEAARLTEAAARLTAQAADATRKASYLEHRGQSFETGAEGEIATGRALDSLRAEGWIVLHDLRWPGRPRANIDHIAVGPGGVVVIDTKNWTGRVDVRDEVLRQNGQRREREVASAAEAAIAVVALLPADLHATVRTVICLARDEWVEVAARDVQITSTASLAAFLRGLGSVLSANGVGRAVQALQLSLGPRSAPAVTSPISNRSLKAKSTSRRSGQRRQASQPAGRPTRGRARSSKRKQQTLVPLVFALAVILMFIFAPTTFTATIEWLSQTLGGAVADAVIPDPTATPSTSLVP